MDHTARWNHSTSKQDLIEIFFEQAGEYEISMITSLGDCRDIYSQNVLVIDKDLEGNPNEQGIENQSANIKEFTIFPNPSSGEFEVLVELKEAKSISITIFSLQNNAIIAQQRGDNSNAAYNIPFNIQTASGLYAVVLETPYGRRLQKIVIQ